MRRFDWILESKPLFVFVLASLLVSSLAQRYLGHPMSVPNLDFFDYYFAARVIHDNPHATLYEGATEGNPEIRPTAPAGSALAAHARAAGFDRVEFYVYPPLLADLIAPISQIPPRLAATLWRCLNLALVLVSLLLLAGMLRVPILSFEFVTLAMAGYCFWPIHETVSLGQIAIVMMLLWTVGIVAYFDNHMILSAAALALATSFKVTPILLLPLFFIWKDKRWIVSYLSILLGLIVAMVSINGVQVVSAYAGVMSGMGGGLPAFQNKSIGSLLAWIYFGRIFPVDEARSFMANQPQQAFLSIMSKAVSGIFYLFSLFLAWRSRHQLDRTSRAASIAVFGMVTACVSPVSWRHGYSVAFVVMAILWVRALRKAPRRLHLVLLTLTTFTVGSLFFDQAAQTPLPEPCKIILAASWIVFSVLLCLDALFYANIDNRVGVAIES